MKTFLNAVIIFSSILLFSCSSNYTEKSLKFIFKIVEKTKRSKVNYFKQSAIIYYNNGNTSKCIKMLNNAHKIISDRNILEQHMHDLGEIAELYNTVGKKDLSINIMNKLYSIPYFGETEIVAEWFAKIGNFEKALEIAENIENDRRREDLLVNIANHCLKYHHKEMALKILAQSKEITEKYSYNDFITAHSYIKYVDIYTNTGNNHEALNLITKINKNALYDLTLSSPEDVIDFYKSYNILDPNGALTMLSQHIQFIKNIERDAHWRAKRLLIIASCYTEMDLKDKAKNTLEIAMQETKNFGDHLSYEKQAIVADIAVGYAAMGEFQEAIQTLKSCNHFEPKAKAARIIAPKLIKNGKNHDAEEIIHEALLSIAKAVSLYPTVKVNALIGLLYAYPEIGQNIGSKEKKIVNAIVKEETKD